jgi:hypothetical protein
MVVNITFLGDDVVVVVDDDNDALFVVSVTAFD